MKSKVQVKVEVKMKVKKWVWFVHRMTSPCFPWPLQDRIIRMALGWRVIVAWNRWAEKMDRFLLDVPKAYQDLLTVL